MLHAITSTSGANILLQGLISGQAYWLRIRGVNENGRGESAAFFAVLDAKNYLLGRDLLNFFVTKRNKVQDCYALLQF